MTLLKNFIEYTLQNLSLLSELDELKYKTVKWKRRMSKDVLTDAEVKLTGYLSERKYPESFRLVRYTMKKMIVSSLFWRMHNNFLHWMSPIFQRKDG